MIHSVLLLDFAYSLNLLISETFLPWGIYIKYETHTCTHTRVRRIVNSAFSAQLYGVSVVSVLQQRVSFVTTLKAFILLHSCSFSLLSSVFKVKLHSLTNGGAPGKSHGLSSACELICLSVQVRVLAAVWMPQHEGRDCSRMLNESANLYLRL